MAPLYARLNVDDPSFSLRPGVAEDNMRAHNENLQPMPCSPLFPYGKDQQTAWRRQCVVVYFYLFIRPIFKTASVHRSALASFFPSRVAVTFVCITEWIRAGLRPNWA